MKLIPFGRVFFFHISIVFICIENLFAPFQKDYQQNTHNLKRLIQQISIQKGIKSLS